VTGGVPGDGSPSGGDPGKGGGATGGMGSGTGGLTGTSGMSALSQLMRADTGMA
jgi:hypothetical protein